jgi:hypothetical protein
MRTIARPQKLDHPTNILLKPQQLDGAINCLLEPELELDHAINYQTLTGTKNLKWDPYDQPLTGTKNLNWTIPSTSYWNQKLELEPYYQPCTETKNWNRTILSTSFWNQSLELNHTISLLLELDRSWTRLSTSVVSNLGTWY